MNTKSYGAIFATVMNETFPDENQHSRKQRRNGGGGEGEGEGENQNVDLSWACLELLSDILTFLSLSPW